MTKPRAKADRKRASETGPRSTGGWLCAALAASALACGGGGAGGGAPPGNDDSHVIDTRASAGSESAIAAEGGNVVVAYTGLFETGGVYLAPSSDSGATFPADATVLVDAAGVVGRGDPAVALSGGAVFLAYAGGGSPTAADFRVARSDDGGATFPVRAVFPEPVLYPGLAVSGNHVYVVYQVQGTVMTQVLLRRSDDCGATWSDPVQVSDPEEYSVNGPSMAVSGGDVFVTYSNGASMRTARSVDGGDSWTLDAPIMPGPRPVQGFGRPLVATADRLLVPIGAGGERFVGESRDAGATWTLRPFPNEVADGSVSLPRVAVSGTTTYAIFNQWLSPSRDGVGFARSTDFGETWSGDSFVTVFEPNGSWAAMAMAFATDGASRTLLLTVFDAAIERLRVVRSVDDGATWQLASR